MVQNTLMSDDIGGVSRHIQSFQIRQNGFNLLGKFMPDQNRRWQRHIIVARNRIPEEINIKCAALARFSEKISYKLYP